MPPRLLLLIAGSTAIVLGVVWFIIGGIPQSYDEYGKVQIGFLQEGDAVTPEQAQKALTEGGPGALTALMDKAKKKANSAGTTVDVPEGEVRLNWEGGVENIGGGSRSASEQPDDLEVVVVQESTGEQIKTEGAGGYDSVVGDTGWVSWRKFEAPEAGTYIVSANSDSGAGFLTIGKAFWNPGGSRVLGALLPVILVFGLIFGGYAALDRLRANR
jgi:hypothetical protein